MKNPDLNFTSGRIAEVCGGKLYGPADNKADGYTIDSRETQAGDIFIAIRGERFDGNDFAAQAAEKASVVICERLPEELNEKTSYITVPDSVRALADLSKAHKNDISPLTVAVTGSVGKTTTRQLTYCVLSAGGPTCVTKGNFNNEIGLPLTLLSLRKQDRYLVAEMGMNHFGEIERLSDIAEPDYAIITNIGTSHIEYLGSREGIRDAKLEIKSGLRENGLLIADGDEPLLAGRADIYCSITDGNADYYACNIKATEAGTSFDVKSGGVTEEGFFIPLFGDHTVKDALYAVAAGKLLNLPVETIKKGLRSYEAVGSRQKIYTVGDDIEIIEDCYNASPESMRASLSVLSDLSSKRPGKSVAVLGDMGELGSFAEKLHASVGEYLGTLDTDEVVTFGELARLISDGHFFPFGEEERAAEYLKEILSPGDTVLFKASRFVELEKICERLKELL